MVGCGESRGRGWASTELLTYIRGHTTFLQRLRIVWTFQKKTNGLSCEPVYYHVREAAGDNVFIREHGCMLITFIYHLKAVAEPACNYEKQREEIKHGRNKKVKRGGQFGMERGFGASLEHSF